MKNNNWIYIGLIFLAFFIKLCNPLLRHNYSQSDISISEKRDRRLESKYGPSTRVPVNVQLGEFTDPNNDSLYCLFKEDDIYYLSIYKSGEPHNIFSSRSLDRIKEYINHE